MKKYLITRKKYNRSAVLRTWRNTQCTGYYKKSFYGKTTILINRRLINITKPEAIHYIDRAEIIFETDDEQEFEGRLKTELFLHFL